MKCSLCGYEFDETDRSCHTGCPMSKNCNLICCPHCGYQTVDTSRSPTARLLEKLLDRGRLPKSQKHRKS